MSDHEGVPSDLLAFLRELEANNEKAWFDQNRERYERSWVEPALGLCRALEAPLREISPHIRVVAKKAGGSVMRIHRDVRFSKDKTPYTASLTLRFLHDEDKVGPGYYLRIDPQQVHVGAGIWRPDAPRLTQIRNHLVEHRARWVAVRDDPAFRGAFGPLAGGSLQRGPKGFDPNHPLIEDLKRQDFAAFATWPADEAVRPDLVSRISERYRAAAPFVGFLCEALGLTW